MLDRDTLYMGHTPHGRAYTMTVRPGTSDWNTAHACGWVNDEYHIPEGIMGWAVDVGAHIGAWVVPFALDNPSVRVIAIEALPENREVLIQNLQQNGLADRVRVAAVAAGDGSAQKIYYTPSDEQHRFIGNADFDPSQPDRPHVEVPGQSLLYTLAQIRHLDEEARGIEYLKTDCEKCEYPYLGSGGIEQVRVIVGEVHAGWEPLAAILEPTHELFPEADALTGFGHFRAVAREWPWVAR